MSGDKLEIIAWNDQESIEPILRKHIIDVRKEASEGAADLFGQVAKGLNRNDREWLLAQLFSIVGTEVEGQEVSCGILFFLKNGVPDDISDRFLSAKLGRWEGSNALVFGSTKNAWDNFRKLIRTVRSELMGWFPGRFLEPIVIVGDKNALRVQGVKLIKPISGDYPFGLTAHHLYSEITKGGDGNFALWIKPAGTIRLYSDGRLLGQIMRLRDLGGWTTRHIDRIVDIVRTVAGGVGLDIGEGVCRRWIVEPSISMSEIRRGCTIVVVPKEKFEPYEEAVPIGWHAKHRPGEKENKLPNSEAEYENYLAQDGAVVISPDGKLLSMGTYFKGGPGGRRETAMWLPSAIRECITIVTSQDGPIFLYWPVGRKRSKGVRLDFLWRKDSPPIEVEPKKTKRKQKNQLKRGSAALGSVGEVPLGSDGQQPLIAMGQRSRESEQG